SAPITPSRSHNSVTAARPEFAVSDRSGAPARTCCERSANSALPRILWSRLRRVQDDAFAEQVEAGAAVHLALEHLDLIDGALDPAGVPVQGEAVDDGLLVVADAGGQGAQPGLVVGFDGGEPGLEVAAA